VSGCAQPRAGCSHEPNFTKAIAALVPVAMLLLGSVVLLGKTWSAAPLLQLVGASGLMIVVLSHVCEALVLMTWMKWGQERSVGHYVDLCGALIGITVFPVGYLLYAFVARRLHRYTDAEPSSNS